MPVTILTGARQTGKSTIARTLESASRPYLNLDTPAELGLARADPTAFVTRDECLIIDEVQREPDLLLAIKAAVDSDRPRRAGRFLLTGSANLLLMKRVRESLAGRAAFLTLHPMTRREQLGMGESGIWGELLATPVAQWRDLVHAQAVPAEEWRDVTRRGGYPPAVIEIDDSDGRRLWFDGYVRTYLQRDVPDISAIENVPDFDKVLRSIALRVGTLVNQTQLAREASIPQSTVQRYVNVMETSYQLHRLEAYSVSRTKQLVKSPKYYWCDSGLAMALSREVEPRGEHFENFVALDLFAWRDAQITRPEVMYWRTSKGREVDFVVDNGNRLLPIEVKTTIQPSTGDLDSMAVFLEEYEDRAQGGLLMYAGERAFWIARNVLAVPWWMVI